jgi:putative membrane protein
MRIVVRWLITALALLVAVKIVPGLEVTDSSAWVGILGMAAVLGLVNAFVRPILALLSCPFILLTLGLFLLVVNGAAFMLAGWLAAWLGIGFQVDGFWPALYGSLVVSVVSFVVTSIIGD